MNFSDFKQILEDDGKVQNYINKKYGNKIDIKYSNVGFIIVPINSTYVIKYYIPDSYIASKFGELNEYNLFEKEKINYSLFKKNNILIPEYISDGKVNIGDHVFKYAQLENIRQDKQKIKNFNELNTNDFVNFISKMHNIKSGYAHGNIHVNDFFVTKEGKIGIFNLSSYYKGDIEEDLAKICYGYNLDISSINSFLLKYGINKIKLNKLLLNVYNLTKLYNYKKNDFIKLVNLIKKYTTYNSNITKCTPFDKKISIIIHLNYTCNFKCSYCIAGLETSNDYLSIGDINILFDIIKELYDTNKGKKIEVDINGGEPTIHKDFVTTVTKFLSINNIKLQVSTNGYLLYSLKDKLFNSDVLLNKSKLKFNISFHYFEYKDKLETFVKSINLLLEHNINFDIKFLLPDKNESLSSFLKIRDYLFEKTSIKRNNFNYFLIMNFKGGISSTYDEKILDFYYKSTKEEIDYINTANENDPEFDDYSKLDSVLLEYSDGTTEACLQEELKSKGFNNFKGFNCFYITDKIALIYIAPNGEVTFGSCILLDKNKFKISDMKNILFSGEQSILCTHKTCTSGLNLPKIKSPDYYKIQNLENILKKHINKVINNIKLEDVQIALSDRVILLFKVEIYSVTLIIEKDNGKDKYHFLKNDIGYNLRIKDAYNIVYSINNIDRGYVYLINKNINILSTLDFLYKKIF